MTNTYITTEELIDFLKDHADKCVQASLILNQDLCSSHFLTYNSSNQLLYDEGCDGEERAITPDEFANDSLYGDPTAYWAI